MAGLLRLLLLAPLRAGTGNVTTARRIQEHLEAAGHVCVIQDTSDFESPLAVADLISSKNFEAALGIHLYKAGRLLQGSGIPFGIIFGGTDINEDAKREEKSRVMGAILDEARFAVSFTEAMKETAAAHWPRIRNKIHVQSQGIVTTLNVSFNWKKFLQSTGIPQDNNNVYLFLLICSLRRVKDPLYLVDAFSDWHKKEPSVHLIIIGPTVDPVFAEEVKEKVRRADGVHLLPTIPQEDLHAAVKNCLAVVNSSISEGMSAAILEVLRDLTERSLEDHSGNPPDADRFMPRLPSIAVGFSLADDGANVKFSASVAGLSLSVMLKRAMNLKVPVLARNIPGNAAIITHKATGLLYSSPQEFIQLSKSLISDPSLQREIVTRAKEYVGQQHSWTHERKAYQSLVLNLH